MKEIFERVSIRKYEDKPVESDKIQQILKAAMAAPSAGNQQPGNFMLLLIRKKSDSFLKSAHTLLVQKMHLW